MGCISHFKETAVAHLCVQLLQVMELFSIHDAFNHAPMVVQDVSKILWI